ncbi:hypothetical protein [Methylobacterium sp. ap11]|uniref:hypothetical protein n=1 Tax=Methylobacterium sp. ap11 TaxID=1761799 RepID=UPI00116095B5|nr:hypothetical protein [Methylobacterium sp. ap11]
MPAHLFDKQKSGNIRHNFKQSIPLMRHMRVNRNAQSRNNSNFGKPFAQQDDAGDCLAVGRRLGNDGGPMMKGRMPE